MVVPSPGDVVVGVDGLEDVEEFVFWISSISGDTAPAFLVPESLLHSFMPTIVTSA